MICVSSTSSSEKSADQDRTGYDRTKQDRKQERREVMAAGGLQQVTEEPSPSRCDTQLQV